MFINIIIEKLKMYAPESYINNKSITFIQSVKYLENTITDFVPDILYVGEMSNFPINHIHLHEANFLIISKDKLPHSIAKEINCNIIFISSNSIVSIFNSILDIFSEYQRLSYSSSRMLDALLQDNGLQNIVNIGFELIGNPIFVRNANLNILTFTENIEVDIPVWENIKSRGYQIYNKLHKFLTNEILSSAIPIYLKSPNSRFNIREKTGNEITENSKSVLYVNSNKNIKFAESRIWSNIYCGNKFLGQAVILEVFKPFKESDISLINQLSATLSIELQKHKYYETTNADNRDLLILDLLNEKIKNQEAINENLKFANWNLNEWLRIISITMEQEKISLIQFKFILNFLKKIFPDSVCVLYDGNIVIVINYIDDKTFLESYSKKLNTFLDDQNIFCGISRPFSNLIDISKYYKQSLKSIELGKHLNGDKFIFFYDSYILQHIFSLCSGNESLKEFCHPSLLELIDYDKKYNTDYVNTLYSYIINFKNQTELAKLMNVHRNTLYYRISKIEEIININLNNIDEFVSIYLSFKILEYTGGKIFNHK
ncbi:MULTISPECIES: helix-turn-helix domain-containing protein [Clostridium]|uniref:Helix-turn-helix domain-containing protein n=1 Tax=Clostridium cibarium TaxID=2762247 RepID=A0ABR8PSU8_9CLOT|nr:MULTISPECIES: helix-turn-helix domain-containing protein [Clostridium]MBD7911249.1 helix-turn-helix domain-containing protein [Clostridium cibarium]